MKSTIPQIENRLGLVTSFISRLCLVAVWILDVLMALPDRPYTRDDLSRWRNVID